MYPFVGFAVGLMVGKIFEKQYKAVWYEMICYSINWQEIGAVIFSVVLN